MPLCEVFRPFHDWPQCLNPWLSLWSCSLIKTMRINQNDKRAVLWCFILVLSQVCPLPPLPKAPLPSSTCTFPISLPGSRQPPQRKISANLSQIRKYVKDKNRDSSCASLNWNKNTSETVDEFRGINSWISPMSYLENVVRKIFRFWRRISWLGQHWWGIGGKAICLVWGHLCLGQGDRYKGRTHSIRLFTEKKSFNGVCLTWEYISALRDQTVWICFYGSFWHHL